MSTKCHKCGKTAYVAEQVCVDKEVFHKHCFRCEHCESVLTVNSFAAIHGRFYCKPHFLQLVKQAGNYDEGFGKQKMQHEHDQKSGKPVDGDDYSSVGHNNGGAEVDWDKKLSELEKQQQDIDKKKDELERKKQEFAKQKAKSDAEKREKKRK